MTRISEQILSRDSYPGPKRSCYDLIAACTEFAYPRSLNYEHVTQVYGNIWPFNLQKPPSMSSSICISSCAGSSSSLPHDTAFCAAMNCGRGVPRQSPIARAHPITGGQTALSLTCHSDRKPSFVPIQLNAAPIFAAFGAHRCPLTPDPPVGLPKVGIQSCYFYNTSNVTSFR